MASTTDLGKWMLTNGGEYNPETAYEHLTMVMYENSTYITLKTVQGVTPTDDHVNYQLMAKGFNPTALASVQAKDTSGVLGEAGGTVSAQDLVDWVVDQAANKLLKLTDLVSVQTNDATKGVSAALAYAMNQKIEQTNSNITAIRKRVYGSYWIADSDGKTYLTISLKDFGFSGTIGEYPCAQVSVQTTNANINSDICALGYKVQNSEQITVFLNKAFTGGLTIAVAINLQ